MPWASRLTQPTVSGQSDVDALTLIKEAAMAAIINFDLTLLVDLFIVILAVLAAVFFFKKA